MGGRKIGEAEEGYFEQLTPGDTFIFAGQVWRYNSLVGADAFVSPAPNDDPKMPSWGGSKFPLSTYLASRVRQMMHDEREWTALPPDVQEWLAGRRSVRRSRAMARCCWRPFRTASASTWSAIRSRAAWPTPPWPCC
jgi:Lhr-like helicase